MRGIRRALVVLVVLAALVVAGDRVAAWAAEQVVADQTAGELADYQVEAAPPEVSIGGFPFVTQVVAGRYEEVTLRLRHVGTGTVRLPLVELTATGVDAPLSTVLEREGRIVADRMTGAATVGYEQVRAVTGRDGLVLGAADDGMSVRLSAEVMGSEVTLVGTASVEVAGHAVRARVQDLSVADGELPASAQPLVAQLAQELSVDVPLPPLPYGLSVESVQAEPAGLVVTVTAANVPLSR